MRDQPTQDLIEAGDELRGGHLVGELKVPRAMGTSDAEYLDSLELRDAVIAEDLVLEALPDVGFALHQISGCRAHRLWSVTGAAEAWDAIDAIDLAASPRA